MGDVTLSGYKVAATEILFSDTQQIDSLADDEWTDESDEIDNSSPLYMLADFELVLGSAAFTGTDSMVELYLIPSVDGTNYPSWTGNVTTDEQENAGFFVGVFVTTGATEAQRMVLRDVPLPNGKWRVGVRNRSGVGFAGSGNTLNYRPWQFTSN